MKIILIVGAFDHWVKYSSSAEIRRDFDGALTGITIVSIGGQADKNTAKLARMKTKVMPHSKQISFWVMNGDALIF